ncbi:hypothetical protein ACLKA7_015324 [Drosophila subpalustris]
MSQMFMMITDRQEVGKEGLSFFHSLDDCAPINILNLQYFFIRGNWSCSYLEYPQLGDGKARLTFKAAGHAVGGAGGGGGLCTAECPDVYGQFKLALDKQLTGGLAKEGGGGGGEQTVAVQDTDLLPPPCNIYACRLMPPETQLLHLIVIFVFVLKQLSAFILQPFSQVPLPLP